MTTRQLRDMASANIKIFYVQVFNNGRTTSTITLVTNDNGDLSDKISEMVTSKLEAEGIEHDDWKLMDSTRLIVDSSTSYIVNIKEAIYEAIAVEFLSLVVMHAKELKEEYPNPEVHEILDKIVGGKGDGKIMARFMDLTSTQENLAKIEHVDYDANDNVAVINTPIESILSIGDKDPIEDWEDRLTEFIDTKIGELSHINNSALACRVRTKHPGIGYYITGNTFEHSFVKVAKEVAPDTEYSYYVRILNGK